MAQPSGLSSSDGRLWVVDSETSSLRYLDRSGRLLTVVGAGLFDFGYRDGVADRALLQHPLGVVATPGGPVVCDTYNSALRRYDPASGELTTLAREGLSEPSGAALFGQDLLTGDGLPARARLSLGAADGKLYVLLRVGTCGEGPGAVCTLNERRWLVTVRRDEEGSPRLNLGLGG